MLYEVITHSCCKSARRLRVAARARVASIQPAWQPHDDSRKQTEQGQHSKRREDEGRDAPEYVDQRDVRNDLGEHIDIHADRRGDSYNFV